VTTHLATRTDTPSGSPDGPQRCTEIRRDGRPCSAQVVRGGHCIGHLPNSNLARAKGGQNSARAVRAEKRLPGPLRVVGQILRETLQEVRDGELTPAQGNAMASIASAIIRVHESTDMEERMAQMEARVEGGQP